MSTTEKRCCSRLFWLRWQQRSIQVFFLCLWTRVCQVYISKDGPKATKVWVLISGGGWGKRNNNRQFSTIQHLQQQQTHEFCEGWGNSLEFLGSQQQSILDLLGILPAHYSPEFAWLLLLLLSIQSKFWCLYTVQVLNMFWPAYTFDSPSLQQQDWHDMHPRFLSI